MTSIRRSPGSKTNPDLKEVVAEDAEGNEAWLRRAGGSDGILLLGGSSLAHFRMRVAQSSLRSDMLPSFWSFCGVLLDGGQRVATVPLETQDDVSSVPGCNGIRTFSRSAFDDPVAFPNIAVVRFAKTHETVHEDIARLRMDRSIIDLPGLILPWLGFVWGTAGSANPLFNGIGLPSAAFVETVFAMSGFELTPGLSSASSCPEAIWQSAKWWAGYYEGRAGDEASPHAIPLVPTGVFATRQPAASVVEHSSA